MNVHGADSCEYRACVLVVEDDDNVRSSIVKLLQSQRFHTREARTVSEAERVAIDVAPDAMTLDLILPDGRGESVVAHLIAAELLPPTVVISVALDQDSRHRLQAMGLEDFLTKPFDNQALIQRVQGALQRGLHGAVVRRAGLSLDLIHHEVKYRGRSAQLPDHAFLMLHHCLVNIGRVVTHDEIVHIAWRELHGFSRNLPSKRAGRIREAFAELRAPHKLEGSRCGFRLTPPEAIGH